MISATGGNGHDHVSDLRGLATGGTLTVLGVIASGVLQFVLVVLLTRSLGAAGAGILFQAIAVFMILTNVAEFGADTGLVRSVPSYLVSRRAEWLPGLLAVALWPVLFAAVLLGIAMFALASQLSQMLMAPTAADDGIAYLRTFALFLPLSALSTVVLAGTRGFGTMIPFVAVENVGKPALRLILVLLSLAVGAKAVGIALSWAGPIAIGSVAAVIWWRVLLRKVAPRLTGDAPARAWRSTAADFWSFAAPRGVAAIFQTSSVWVGIIMVGALAEPSDAGIFGAVNRLVIMGTFVLAAVNLALGPQMSALFVLDHRERAGRLFRTAAVWLICFSWPIYITLAVFAPLVLRLFGPDFVEGQNVLVVLCLGMLVNMGTGNCHIVLLMGGKSGWNLANTIVAVSVNVILGFALVPTYGALGAAVAWAAAIAIDNIATVVEVRLLLRLQPFEWIHVRTAAAALLCFGGVGLLVRLALGASVQAFLLFGLLSAALYAAFLLQYRDQLSLRFLWQAARHRTASPSSGAASTG